MSYPKTITLTSVDISRVKPAPRGLEAAATELFHVCNTPTLDEAGQARVHALLQQFPKDTLSKCRYTIHFKDHDPGIVEPECTATIRLSHLAAYHNHAFALPALKAAGFSFEEKIRSAAKEGSKHESCWWNDNSATDVAMEKTSLDVLIDLYKAGHRSNLSMGTARWEDLLPNIAEQKQIPELLELLPILQAEGEYLPVEHIWHEIISQNNFDAALQLLQHPISDMRKNAYVEGQVLKYAAEKDRYNQFPEERTHAPQDPHAPSWVELCLQKGSNPDLQQDGFGDQNTPSQIPAVYFSVLYPDAAALEKYLQYGANLMAESPGEKGNTVVDFIAAQRDKPQNRQTIDLIKRYLEAGNQTMLKHMMPSSDPMSVTQKDVYALCNIGKAEELFMQESWQNPKAAEHALQLIDSLIPCQQQNLFMARTALEPFAPAPKTSGIHDAEGRGPLHAPSTERGKNGQ